MKTNGFTNPLPSLALALAALLIALPTTGRSEAMNYQGRLTDNSGVALTQDSATIVFNIWNHPTSTLPADKKWGPFNVSADLIDGRFNVVLGPLDAGSGDLAAALVGVNPAYIHMTVTPLGGTTNAALPRQQIYAAPKALSAEIAVTVPDAAIGTTQLADLAVTGDKIMDNTIPVSKLTGAGANFWDGNGTDVWRPTGKVGIGTASPTARLHVVGTTTLHGLVEVQTLEVQTPGAETGRIHVGGTGANGDSKIVSFGNLDLVTIGESGADDRMVLRAASFHFNEGNVGIGTDTPQVKLDVVGSKYITMVDNRYDSNNFSITGSTYTWVGQVHGSGRGVEVYGMDGSYGLTPDYNVLAPLGIRSDGWIASAMGIVVYSDRRIKRDMQASPKVKDLAAIQQLQVTDYRMVDPGDGGMAWRKGFIAQEVEKVMPLAVSRSTEFVPDIFSVATAVAYDPAVKTLTLTLAKDHGLKSGDRVRLHIDGKREDLNVSAVPSAREFVMEQCENKPEKVLVYGKQVSDFRTVNYDHIFTTSVGAVQELARKVETQELECTELRESNVALRSRVAALEAKDRIRDTKIASIEKLLNSINPPSTRTISLKSE
jgi:hypothetical protein